ncbi:MAG: NUDIX hydrolase [Hyphomicrobium sp.]|nr:NUDIX hydrolase [Hyphomicrobium sp.]
MTLQPSAMETDCVRVGRCALQVADWQWPLAKRREEIARDWRRRLTENPQLFDGAVYLMREYALDGAGLIGTLFRTDFKTFLYWRALPGSLTEPVREAFGASLIRSADGYVLLGRQGPGQLNSGRIYPPGGLIDTADVRGGTIDMDASIARELAEETGLAADDLQRVPGYLVARVGLKVAVAIEWRSALPASELRGRILANLRRQPEPELDDIVPIRSRADIDESSMPPHARALVRTVLPA